MINRVLFQESKEFAKEFKVLCITGPRQSGKTTLCKHIFKNKPYVSLEDIDKREKAENDPRGFLHDFKDGAILDEIQRVPEIFNYLQTLVDEREINNQFILSGSNNFLLQQNISQSLAGRAGYIELLPFSLQELQDHFGEVNDIFHYFLNGFYPPIVDKKSTAAKWLPNYIKTYIERDVRLIRNIGNINLFSKFIKLVAARAGQILNVNNIANETGVDHKTIGAWLSILESSYIVFRLQPYYNSYNKRIIKSPKVYFYDVGLLCNILGITSKNAIMNSNFMGPLFENFVIAEMKKNRYNKHQIGEMYYLRDSAGNEVDVVLEKDGQLIPIEIKSSTKNNKDDIKNLKWFQRFYRITGGILINRCEEDALFGNEITQINWKQIGDI